MYFPYDDTQNYHFYGFRLVVEVWTLNLMNQPILTWVWKIWALSEGEADKGEVQPREGGIVGGGLRLRHLDVIVIHVEIRGVGRGGDLDR